MALYAIGDLHLSLGTNKPMDVFGPKWANYVERIRENFSKLNDDDVIVIAGDISWGCRSSSRCRIFSLLTRCRGGRSS